MATEDAAAEAVAEMAGSNPSTGPSTSSGPGILDPNGPKSSGEVFAMLLGGLGAPDGFKLTVGDKVSNHEDETTWQMWDKTMRMTSPDVLADIRTFLNELTPEEEAKRGVYVQFLRYGMARHLALNVHQHSLAKPLYHKAFRACKQQFGPDHPGTVLCMEGVARSLLVEHQNTAAAALYKEVLEARRRRAGDPGLVTDDIVHTLVNLGNALVADKKHADAIDHLRTAYQWFDQKGALDTAAGQKLAISYGDCYLRLGQAAEAETVYRRALQNREKATGTDHTVTVMVCYLGLADACAQMQQWRKVVDAGREAETWVSKVAPQHRPALAVFVEMLKRQQVKALVALGRHKEAARIQTIGGPRGMRR